MTCETDEDRGQTRDQSPETCLSPKSMNITTTRVDSSHIVASSWDTFSLHLLENSAHYSRPSSDVPFPEKPSLVHVFLPTAVTSPVISMRQGMKRP